MSVYTKRGDKGITDMARTKNVSKSDDRIQLVGAIDELNSHIGLVKCMLKWEETVKMLSSIQDNLDLIAAGVEDPYRRLLTILRKRRTDWKNYADSRLEKKYPGRTGLQQK